MEASERSWTKEKSEKLLRFTHNPRVSLRGPSAFASCGIVGGYNLQKEPAQENEPANILGD
jgi:hypothetical protein